MAWFAAICAAFAAALCVAAPIERRLRPPLRRRLPGWLEPVPDALGVRPRGFAAAVLAAAVALWTGQLGWGALVAALGAGAATFLLLGRATPASRARRSAELTAALPQVCDLLGAAVSAGLPLRTAVQVVAETIGGAAAEPLAGIAARVRLGIPETDAWAELSADDPWQSVAREISRTVGTGLGLAQLLRDLARQARLVAASEAVIRARRVGVRSTLPLMVCFLPSFILLGVVPVVGGIISMVLP